MIISCKYKKDGICLCSGGKETVKEVEKKMGWSCCNTCPWQVSIYTKKDRDIYLKKSLLKIKKDNVGDLCLKLMSCGHRANVNDDEYAILYDACIIRLIQLHERKYISGFEYCQAYELAKRLGIRLPMRSNKIYRRLKKVYFSFRRKKNEQEGFDE